MIIKLRLCIFFHSFLAQNPPYRKPDLHEQDQRHADGKLRMLRLVPKDLHTKQRADRAAGRRQKTAVQGQLSLFDAVEDVEIAPPPLPDVPDFSRQEQLRMEREVTGVYITGHPLDEYRERLEKMPCSVQVLQEYAEDEEWEKFDRMNVTIGGMIIETRMNTTKANKLMCFITLEDLYGTIECLVFPRIYDRLARMIQNDTVVVIRGTLSLREDEEPKLLVEDIRPLDSADSTPLAPERPKRLYLKIENRALTPMAQNLLREHPGSMVVRAVIQGTVYELPLRVAPDGELIKALENLLGGGSVKIA